MGLSSPETTSRSQHPHTHTRSMASRRRPYSRRTLSCLPCRQHKLKCDRRVPCLTCTRYHREDQCRQHPAPSTLLGTAFSDPPESQMSIIAPAPESSTTSSSLSLHHQTQRSSHGRSSSQEVIDSSAHRRLQQASTELSSPSKSIGKLPVSQLRDPWRPAISPPPANGFPYYPSLLPARGALDGDIRILHDPMNIKLFWKFQLTATLPSRNQCDLLLCYYIENVNWLYQAVHVPSFRQRYASFWAGTVEEVDLSWLSLLLTIISISTLLLPSDSVEVMGFENSDIRHLAHVWHSASRQALYYGDFESRPRLIQLVTFLTTQIYWLATKNIEAMNSALGQAVRNAQAIGLDKDDLGSNCLDTELRRRAWWDLWCCDTFQSLCLDRPPLIHTSASKVPLPLNCNDGDITEASAVPRPMEEPTEMSATICRAQAFQVFRKMFIDDGAYLSSYDYIQFIDREVQQLVDHYPWYFQMGSGKDDVTHPRPDYIAWQHCVLHIAICMQRIRMNRPFLHARLGESWNVCARAAQNLLSVYRNLRKPDVERFRCSPKFMYQGYQIYTAAVTLAAFLLVEHSFPDFPSELMRRDIEMVISDLEHRDTGASLIVDGTRILRKMLRMYDQRDTRDQQVRESLVHEIASVFGGEQSTRKYLRRCDIGYVLNANPQHPRADEPRPLLHQSQEEITSTRLDPDMMDSNQDQWLSPDLDWALELLGGDQWDLLQSDLLIPPYYLPQSSAWG